LTFFGLHGLYEAEKKVGNNFKVDVLIDFTPAVSVVDHLDQTIDYVKVYEMVKSIMVIPTPLLETLVCKIADSVLKEHAIADKVTVSITKEKLPVPYFEGDTTVSIEKKR
jgi:dihydroneopterin aldolase